MWDPYSEFEQTVLPNGLTLHSLHLPDRPWVKVRFIVHCGGERDPVGKEGLTHFVEHMVSKNGPLPYLEMSRFFYDVGGSVAFGTTTPLATYFDFTLPADAKLFSKALNLFGKLLFLGKLEKGIEHEREVIVREFHKRYPVPSLYELALFRRKVLFPGMWQSRMTSVLGTLESLKHIEQQDLQSHYDQHYTPKNIEVVCVGGFSVSAITDLMRLSLLAEHKSGQRATRFDLLIDTPLPTQSEYTVEMSKYLQSKSESASYDSFCLVPIKDQASEFGKDIAFSMFHSTLQNVLRFEKGLVYSVSSDETNYRTFLLWQLGVEGVLPSSVGEVSTEVEKILDSLLTDTELFLRKKSEFVKKILMRDPSGQGILKGASNDLIENGRISTAVEDIRGYRAVQFEDVVKVIKLLRASRRFTVITMP